VCDRALLGNADRTFSPEPYPGLVARKSEAICSPA
jgi:hypothetical protein